MAGTVALVLADTVDGITEASDLGIGRQSQIRPAQNGVQICVGGGRGDGSRVREH